MILKSTNHNRICQNYINKQTLRGFWYMVKCMCEIRNMVYKDVTVYILTNRRNIWAKEHSHILFACSSMLRVKAGFFWAYRFCFSPHIVTKRWFRKGTGGLGLAGKPKVTYILKCEHMESPLVNEWDKYMSGHFTQFWERASLHH